MNEDGVQVANVRICSTGQRSVQSSCGVVFHTQNDNMVILCESAHYRKLCTFTCVYGV